MKTSFNDRMFQLWEYRVSHGSLLIRSPKAPGIPTNIDLVCLGVEYLALPRHIRGVDLLEPTPQEVEDLGQLMHKPVQPSHVRIVASEGQRFPIIAASFQVSENDNDIFASPFN